MGSSIMPKFNIKNFIANINKDGVLQTNRFEVFITPPLVLQNVVIDGVNTRETSSLLNFRAENVKIPGIGLMMSDVNRYGVGPMQKMPYNSAFTSNAITFISDGKNSIHKFFYTWMTAIFDSTGSFQRNEDTKINSAASYTTEYKDYYTTDVTVKVYDVKGNLIQEIVMYRAFPEALNDINLNWNDNNNLMKVTVSFSFRDWALVNSNSKYNGASQLPKFDNSATTFAGNPVNYAPGTDATLTTSGSQSTTPLP